MDQQISASKHLIQPKSILKNLIGFSNKWLSLIWGCFFQYLIYIHRDYVKDVCLDLYFYTKIQSYLYILSYVLMFAETESLLSNFRKQITKLKYIILVSNFAFSIHNLLFSFQANQDICRSLSSVNRIHGIVMGIYIIMGLLFSLMAFAQIQEVKEQYKQTKKQ